MEVLKAVFVLPFLDMADSWPFFFEVVIGGLMSGMMYSLVALGFVLIFKASGVFNFAQGAMVLFAALSFVRLMEFLQDTFAPILLALAITMERAPVLSVLALAAGALLRPHLINPRQSRDPGLDKDWVRDGGNDAAQRRAVRCVLARNPDHRAALTVARTTRPRPAGCR